MANLITTLSTLYLSGNFPELVISSAETVRFVLKATYPNHTPTVTVLDEAYEPDANDRVTVQLRSLLTSLLSPELPSIDILEQVLSLATFTIEIDTVPQPPFVVVGAGVERLSDTADNFLAANFLTWQPQVKKVTYLQPEWLTYYFVVSGIMRAKFYNTDGTEKMVALTPGLPAGRCISVNTQFARLWSLGETLVGGVAKERHGIIDVWVEDTDGTRLSYVQRYLFRPSEALDEIYCCKNSLGGIDTFLFTGEKKEIPELEHTAASYDEVLSAVAPDIKRKFSQNTGYFGRKEMAWVWELLTSLSAYHLDDGALKPIVLTSSTKETSDLENLNNGFFEYRIADDRGLPNAVRSASLPANIEIPSPDSELFFLAPRLVDYPSAEIESNLLLPVQSPFLQVWKKLSLGSLRNWIIDIVGTSAVGQSAHSHSNKNILDRILSFLKPDDTEEGVDLDNAAASISKIRVEHLRKDIPDTAAKKITFAEGIVAMSTSSASDMANGVSEEDDDSNEIASAVVEETGGIGCTTIGELTNVTDSADDIDFDNDYALVKLRGTEQWVLKNLAELGTGGAAAGVTIAVQSISDAILADIVGESVVLQYTFSSIYDSDNSSTGAGTAEYVVNNVSVATRVIEQGNNSFNVSQFLITGSNIVRITVLDSTGNSRTLTYSIEMIDLSLTSTFDASQIFSGAFTYKYTPVGAVSKTVHFLVDGIEIATFDTLSTNRQLTQDIASQSHGAHSLRVYMTAEVNGRTVTSNELSYSLICTEQGNGTPIVASAYQGGTVEQYATIDIPYLVYNPASSTTGVDLMVNGSTLTSLSVGRTMQHWLYQLTEVGTASLSIRCGATVRTFQINVTESAILVTAETDGLELYLTSRNRSNSEAYPSEWRYGGIYATLAAFNYTTNGWMAGSRNTPCLRVSGNARVSIPFQPFSSDLRQNGKTIEMEFEMRDIMDYSADVVSCHYGGIGFKVKANEAIFSSEQLSLSSHFKEDARVRIGFVVEELAENRLVYIYVNGIISGVRQYAATDNFQQSTPQSISIGSNLCTIDIYSIRIYSNNLTRYQMLENYIADIDDISEKLAVYRRNQVYNLYSEIDYNKILSQIPCLIITGNLPQYKGDKKTVSILYTDQADPTRSFSSENVQIDVQGTSSQYYPRKNYKTKHRSGFTMLSSGSPASKYALRPGEIPVNVFCFKADFAESSGTHNTGLARLVDEAARAMGLAVPPQVTDDRVRTTIDGFPIVIFHRPTASDPAEFVGKYNFNNDKSTEDTFGFGDNMECWEICNNTSDRVLFKTSDYASIDAESGEPEWLNDFEARYPDDDDINAGYAAGNVPIHLKRLTDWLASCYDSGTDTYDTVKFRNEAATYLDINWLLFYWCISELYGMVDQRAKNMFLTCYDTSAAQPKWVLIFYDNDTVNGLNNEGDIAFSYDIEYHDTQGSLNVWNGAASVLWNCFEAAYSAEIEAYYYNMRQSGAVSYLQSIGIFDDRQASKWCEAIYNMDTQFKYIDPLINSNTDYTYAAQGSRAQHRAWWLYNRFRYLDAKYAAGDNRSDTATMRLYTPSSYGGVAPNADFTLKAFAGTYFRIKYGSYIRSVRAAQGETKTVTAPAVTFNDTETIIYGVSQIDDLGPLAAKYPGTVDVANAVKLTRLIIGSTAAGYSNTNLRSVNVGANGLLREINIANCPSFTSALDISGCNNMQLVYAQGSGITSVILPPSGILEVLHLPGTVTNLTIKNQGVLDDGGFIIDAVGNLATLVVENVPNLNIFTLLARCMALATPVLSRIRLINVVGTSDEGLNLIYGLIPLHGIDDNGYNCDNAVVRGTYNVGAIDVSLLTALNAAFPELTINYTVAKVVFEDPAVEAALLAAEVNVAPGANQPMRPIDTNGDGYLTLEEIRSVVTLSNRGDGNYSLFMNNTNIVTFNELKLFTGLQVIMGELFTGCHNLEEITLPVGPTIVKTSILWETRVRKLVVPEGYTTVEPQQRSNSAVNGILTYPGLNYVELPSTITSLGDGTQYLQRQCVNGNPLVFVCKAVTPPPLADMGMANNEPNLTIYVPDGSVAAYKAAAGWSSQANRIFPISEYEN